MSFQGIEYCKIILKECGDYFTDNVVQHPCIPLYNATCIVLNERIKEIVAPLENRTKREDLKSKSRTYYRTSKKFLSQKDRKASKTSDGRPLTVH